MRLESGHPHLAHLLHLFHFLLLLPLLHGFDKLLRQDSSVKTALSVMLRTQTSNNIMRWWSRRFWSKIDLIYIYICIYIYRHTPCTCCSWFQKDANGFKPLHIPPKTSARNCQVGITTIKLISEPSGKITGVSCLTSQNAQNKIQISYTLAIQHHTGFHRRPAEITWNTIYDHILWSYVGMIFIPNHHARQYCEDSATICHQVFNPWPSMQKPQRRWRSRRWFQTLLGVFIEDPMAAPVSCIGNQQEVWRDQSDTKSTTKHQTCLFLDGWIKNMVCMAMLWILVMPLSDSKIISPVSSKLWALSMVEWSFCRCGPQPYPCATWHTFTSQDKDQAAHFCNEALYDVSSFSSSKRLHLVKLQSQIPFPKLG